MLNSPSFERLGSPVFRHGLDLEIINLLDLIHDIVSARDQEKVTLARSRDSA